MAGNKIDKVILSNEGALAAKYGAAYASALRPAIAALVAADQKRGIVTAFIPLDSVAEMAKYGGKPVTKASSARQNKAAVDAVYKSLVPAYLCLLGAPDVVPHQDLLSPIATDGDAVVPSDIPYACNRAYSRRIQDFFQPTRVVGRLPDIQGGRDASYLAGVLAAAASAVARTAADYAAYLGITAEVWQASTAQSVRNVFGNSAELQVVPPGGPPWPGRLDRRSHFINCHGAAADPNFYGQHRTSYPVAHSAAQLGGVKAGTVVSAECCYGAELYDPALAGGQAGICNTYLARGAGGFFGSSTIAYGPASGNGQADLICQYFLKQVLAGASTGVAALQARLDFIRSLSIADPTDLKTLAQFNLMGDPSIHLVAAQSHAEVVIGTQGAKGLGFAGAARSGGVAAYRASRDLRRTHLAALGQMLGSSMAAVEVDSKRAATGGIEALLADELAKLGASPLELSTFNVRGPALLGAKAMAAAISGAGATVDTVHCAVGELPRDGLPFRRIRVVTAQQQGDQVVLRHLESR